MITLLIIILLVLLVSASSKIGSGVYVKAFCREKTKEKVAYLTFDDGPDALMTPRILNILKSRNAKATFFVIGRKIDGNEAVLRDIIAQGHQIGLHSESHTWKFPLLSKRNMVEELSECRRKIETSTGFRTDLFRPPFGVTNPTVSYAVRTMRLRVVGWSVRSFDTVKQSKCGSARKVMILRRVAAYLRPGAVILLHDRLSDGDEILSAVLDYLDSKGYVYGRNCSF